MNRKAFSLPWLCVFLCVGVASAKADTAQQILDKLPGLIHADAVAAKSAKGTNPEFVRSEEQRRDSIVTQIRDLLARGNDTGAESFLQPLMNADASEALRSACQSLIPQFRKERTEKEEALNAEGEAIVRKACEHVFKADEPKDLDDDRQGLAQWLDKRGEMTASDSSNLHNERTRKSVQAALSFITRWQDYLAARAVGADERSLNETLRTLANSGENGVYLPLQRSAILALIKPGRSERPSPTPTPSRATAAEISAALNTVLDRTKSLEDLPAAIRDIQVLRDDQAGGYNGSNASDLNGALEALQTLHKNALEFKAGLRTNLELASNRYDVSTRITGGIESHLVPLRAQLVALELPRLLNAPADEKPAAGETLDKFWRRLMEAAKQRGDWTTVAQGLEIGRMLVFTAEPRNGENYSRDLDSTGFKNLLAAFNFEAAGQYSQAVAAYLATLGSTVPDLPVKLIGEKLAALKQSHPKEYEEIAGAGYVSDYSDLGRPRYYRAPRISEAAASPVATVTPTPSPVSEPLLDAPKPTAKSTPAVSLAPATPPAK